MSQTTDPLFQPLQMGALKLPNRILMAPLTRCRASDGHVPNALMAELEIGRLIPTFYVPCPPSLMEISSSRVRELIGLQRSIEVLRHYVLPAVADVIEPEMPGVTIEILESIGREIPEYARPLEGAFGRGDPVEAGACQARNPEFFEERIGLGRAVRF